MSKPWGGIGAWAAEAERVEAEEREAAAASGIGSNADSQSFPSLKEAAKEKPKKKKMSLSEFTMGSYSSPAGGVGGARGVEYNRLTPEEMMILPTRPKERSAEEMQYGRLGGGFASYGRSGPPPGRAMRDREESDGSWGTGRRQYGGFNEERRGPPPRASEYDQPSRADEVDNWAMAKKSAPAFDSGRQNRYGGLGTGGGMSRADEVDNWLTGKKPIAARSSSFGSGFRGSAPEPDRWSRGVGGFREERPRLVLDPPRGEANEQVRTNKPDPFGTARPREEVLAQKGLDWKQVDSEIEAKKANERPTSSQSSRPSSAHSSRSETQQPGIENVLRTRPKLNPFGDAKPREVLLQERGQDWRKIDLELDHRRVDRPEQDEERILKEEIDNLREELAKESSGDQSSLRDRLLQKEKDLEMLIRDFDDKIRFGQKVERPGSGAGRIGGFPDRPPSRAGSSDGSRSVDFTNRPRSHGTGDAWTRPGDDRRAFQGGRERGFLNRDMDRSRSRERW